MRVLGTATAFMLLVLALLPQPIAGSQVEPVYVDKDASCSDLAPQGIVWYELQVPSAEDGTYAHDPLAVTLTTHSDDDSVTLDWSSNIGVDGVFVKGGPGGNFYHYDPPAIADTALSAPFNHNSGKYYHPGHLLFCTTTPLLPPAPVLEHGVYLTTICSRWSPLPEEPNNSCATAYAIQPDKTYDFFANDLHDWYRFELERPAEVEIRVDNFLPLRGQVAAYSGSDCESAQILKNYGYPSPVKTLSLGQQPAGPYLLYVSNDGVFDSTVPYHLIVETR